MKKSMRMMAVAMSAFLAISATGCNLVKVDEKKDLAQVVASVNDTEISKDEYQSMYDQWSAMYSQYGQEPGEELKGQVLDSMIQREVLKQKAQEEGMYEFDDETQKEFDEYVEGYMDYYSGQFMDKAREEKGESATEEEVALRARELLDADIDGSEEYTREKLMEDLKGDFVMGKLQTKIGDTVTVTDEDIQTWYDTELEAQKTAADTDPASFESANPALYVPEGYRKVKHILIKFDEETQTKISELKTKQDEVTAEWGQLSGEDEKANATRIAELRKENEDLKEQIDGATVASKKKAEDILAKVTVPGADFDKMIVEYSEDTAGEEKADPETTFTVGPNSTGLVKEFVDGAMALKEGEVSGLVQSQFGYHIIKNVEDLKAGAVSLEDVKEEAEQVVKAQKQSETWNEQVEKWTEEANIERHEDALKDNSENYDEQSESDDAAAAADIQE